MMSRFVAVFGRGEELECVKARAAGQRIIAKAAPDDIVAGKAVQDVSACVAGQEIILPVEAVSIVVAAVKQIKPLGIGGDRIARLGEDRVKSRSGSGGLGDNIGAGVDVIAVIAKPAAQIVAAGQPIEDIVAGIAVYDVVLVIDAGAVEIGRAGQI